MSGEAAAAEETPGEDLIQQALGGEPEAVEEEVPREYSAIEKEAMDMGSWLPKEEWIEANPDKDPEIWSPARDFVKYGKLQSSMKEQVAKSDKKAREFDERIESLNKLHKAQLDTQISELEGKMRTAVSEADEDGYDSAKEQLRHLEGQRDDHTLVPAAPTKDPSIVAWEAKNAWIDDTEDPRALTAQGAWNNFVAKNPQATIEQTLAHVDKMVAKIATPTNPLRDAAPSTETTQSKPARKGRSLTMNDLNHDERQMWNMTGASMWSGDEAKYLKACADARKGA